MLVPFPDDKEENVHPQDDEQHQTNESYDLHVNDDNKSQCAMGISMSYQQIIISQIPNLLWLYTCSLVPRPHPAFQRYTPAFQCATLKSWVWPGDEVNIHVQCKFNSQSI